LDDKISDTQQQAFSIHWLTVMAKETSKPTEEAVTEIDHSLAIAQNENRHNLAGISKIDHSLAITQP
jgi:hypothetical protein